MKLRNKKSEEIYETTMPIVFNIKTDGGGEHTVSCESISELNSKWEDVPEEPKEYWMIDGHGKVHEIFVHSKFIDEEKEIGNYFESKEEAEQAVEKLKAWQRLKDKGIFIYLDHTDFQLQEGSFNFEFKNNLSNQEMDEADKDLELFFGGEE